MKPLKEKKEKPRILFISRELISGDLAYRLKQEGCDVKLFIEEKGQKQCLDGVVKKTDNWRKELHWVGKDGLIIFDDVEFGKTQDKLRSEGYLVVGGSGEGDRLELDREHGQKILKDAGVIGPDFETMSFTIQSAIDFLKKHKGKWVAKQHDHNTVFNYIGSLDDASDMVSVLEKYKMSFGGSCTLSLQKKVDGVEIAIGRFFNGKNWVGPSIINFEHKHLGNDDVGPLGGETGTLMWYDKNEKNKLFERTLSKIKPYLEASNYKGYIDVNCIVSKNKIYPLEITSRFGSSTIETQGEIHISPWSDFFMALAKGEDYQLKFRKGYSINVALTVSPFPYRTKDKNIIDSGVNIFFEKMSEKDFSHVRFEGVMARKTTDKHVYYTAGGLGYVLYVTGIGKTVETARKKVYRIIDKIIIPKSFYRTDIGTRFIRKDQRLLKKWNWI